MTTRCLIPKILRRHEIPGQVEIVAGRGDLPLVKIRTPWSTAEIYLHGAHVVGFQNNDEPPLVFMSAKSCFAPGKAIRGGVPICFPWFGPREGEPMHGFVRIVEWQLVKTAAALDGTVTLTLALTQIQRCEAWKNLRMEFIVTVAETLTMELVAANDACGDTLKIENCLHTHFYVGDLGAVSITGLENAAFLNFAAGDTGTPKQAEKTALHIRQETNRVYFDSPQAVEIHDEKLKRVIHVEKFNSHSTIVWNRWPTQKLPDDFDPTEYKNMVCVESGNVKQNQIFLAPGKSSALKVVLSSVAI